MVILCYLHYLVLNHHTLQVNKPLIYDVLINTNIRAYKIQEGKKGERETRKEEESRKKGEKENPFCLKAFDISASPLLNTPFPAPTALFL